MPSGQNLSNPRSRDVLHLIKLCVGCDSIRDLEDWISEKLKARRKGAGARRRERNRTTRMAPKRAAEILGGGSLYWVIPGQIMCRERSLDHRPFVGKGAMGLSDVVLDSK